MPKFRDTTIKKKLAVLFLAPTAMAVLLAAFSVYAMLVSQHQHTSRIDLESLTSIIGFNCQAALAFNVPEDATKALSSLKVKPSVVFAEILDGKGRRFASYSTLPQGAGPPPDCLNIKKDIVVAGQTIGVISVCDDQRDIKAARKWAFIILLAATFATIGLAYLLGSRLQESISRPILTLAETSRRITRDHDYSIRAEQRSKDEVGELYASFNTMLDRIENRDNALRESESRFKTLVEQAIDAFILADLNGSLVDVNQQACDSLGYARKELLTKQLFDVFSDFGPPFRETPSVNDLMTTGPVTVEGKGIRKNGDSFPVEARLGKLELDNVPFIMGLIRDISARKQAEQEKTKLESKLIQAQKMESIGTLAGGIAHDFNNILSSIIGYSELTKLKYAGNHGAEKNLDEVIRAGLRAKDLVSQILVFSRGESSKQIPVDIHMILKEALKLLRATIPATIEIDQRIDEDCGLVLADPTQIHQVVMNLCTNSYHAMRETGGVLAISLSREDVSPDDDAGVSADVRPAAGAYAKLEVGDTGCGIDKAIINKIFDPYFTTKQLDEGTGLGLSVVHGIVKNHGGHIAVYSEPGEGTVFSVYFPLAPSSAARAVGDVEKTVPTGSESLLIVDDELQIAEMLKELFTGLGYKATVFTNSLDAFKEFLEHPHDYDLVVTDMTMPHMTGSELARKMLAVRPDIPIVLCSGFSEMINESVAKKMGIKVYAKKPMSTKEMARVVRKALDS